MELVELWHILAHPQLSSAWPFSQGSPFRKDSGPQDPRLPKRPQWLSSSHVSGINMVGLMGFVASLDFGIR